MMQNMVPPPPQEHLHINEEMTSPLGAQIFEFCESELFPENLQNSEAASSSNCCYEEHSSYANIYNNITAIHEHEHDNDNINNEEENNIVAPPPGRNDSNQQLAMLLEDERVVDDISASIDFSTLSPTSFSVPHQYNSGGNNIIHQEAAFNTSNQINHELLAAEGGISSSSLYGALPPSHLYNPMAADQYNVRLRSSSAVGDIPMMGTSSSYLSSTAPPPFSFDSSWLLFTGGGGGGGSGGMLDFSHQEMESQGDNGGFFLPDSLARVFNCSTADLQTAVSSSESQHMVNGSPTLASEISSLDDPTFKVGKLSAEERKRKIHRYLKKRNERNFSKKIKYACRKTLADSRPRVRGRFAKNDELGELARATGNNQDDDLDEDVNQMFRNSMTDHHHHHKGVKDEDGMDPSELFAHISEVNSFKCNYPIQSWI